MKLELYAAAAFISITALLSCAGSDNNDYIDKSLISPATENKTVQAAEPNAATTQTTNTLPNTTPGTTTIIPGTKTVNPDPQTKAVNLSPQNVVIPSPPTNNTQQVTAAGMNPPHGQPNHRCDIAVGAPLNSKPLPATPPATNVTTQQPPVAINTQQQQVQQVTAPGMNPPHGQPNHRCDIAVGAPLNSKPLPATPPATNVTTQQPPVAVNTQQVQQVTAPGMNPPHGQPNHRCDIAVGAPLNSPPGPTTPAKKDSVKN